jgi:PTS system fructose-specific IIC component
MIALAFTVGGIHAGDAKGTLGEALMRIGGPAAFALMVPVLAGFIAFSIADRPGLAPGLVGGMLASMGGAGFLGGLVAGFLAGYVTRWLNQKIQLPETLSGLKPVLILPLLATLVVGLAMVFVVGPPVAATMTALTSFLRGMQSGSAVALGLILGAMMAFDMGGPVNKAAYTFSVGLLSTQVYGPMAAVMAAGMVPPLGLALASTLFPGRFSETERKAGKPAAILGLSFITEGAIPFAAADPLRVIPSLMLGAATAGAIALGLHCQLTVPHGGAFVLLIPNALTPLVPFVVAVAAGTIVTALALRVVKRAPEPTAAEAAEVVS